MYVSEILDMERGKNTRVLKTNFPPLFWKRCKEMIRQNKKIGILDLLFETSNLSVETFNASVEEMIKTLQNEVKVLKTKIEKLESSLPTDEITKTQDSTSVLIN